MILFQKVLRIIKKNPLMIHTYISHYTKVKLQKFKYRRNRNEQKIIKSLLSFYDVKSIDDLQKKINISESKNDMSSLVIQNYINSYESVYDNVFQNALDEFDKIHSGSFPIFNEFIGKLTNEKNTICWNMDYVTKYILNSNEHWSSYSLYQTEKIFDIKRIWEIARLQFLIAPAYLYKVTNDDKYATYVVSIILDFIEKNKYPYGPNWNTTMEVGIRLTNLIFAYDMVKKSPEIKISEKTRIYLSIAEHRKHILLFPEKLGNVKYNHYLGGLLGEIISGCFLRNIIGEKYFKNTISKFNTEVLSQFLSDGGNFEGSTYYHRLSLEMVGVMYDVYQSFNYEIPDLVEMRLIKAVHFYKNLMTNEGYYPQIGDNDSGEIIRLFTSTNNNRNLILLSYLKSIFRNNKKMKFNDSNNQFETLLYNNSNIGVFKSNKIKLYFSAVNSQKYKLGSHNHNDILSFEIVYDDLPIIVDPGTGNYTYDRTLRNKLRSIDCHSTVSFNNLEQRLMSSNVFYWSSQVTCSIHIADDNQCMMGVTRYNNIQHTRTICVGKNVKVKDSFNKAGKFRMVMPIYPGLDLHINNNVVYITNEFVTVTITGTWRFSTITGVYSSNYDKFTITQYIICESDYISNETEFQFSKN